jgi:hypothetical protein
MRSICLAGILSLGLALSALGQTQDGDTRAIPGERKQANNIQARDGFFSFATKMINPRDTNYGDLIAERRAALAEATVTNPYFWYSAGSTFAILFLLFALYVKVLDGKSYLWQCAEVINDLRNMEKLASKRAEHATAIYNQHMSDCNRVIEAEVAGRVLPGVILSQNMERTVDNLRQELETATAENRRLIQQLQEKDSLLRDVTKRMDVLEQSSPSMPSEKTSSQRSNPELLAMVNRLTRELDAEKRRNGALKGA